MKIIPLTQGQHALVDDEDYERVSRMSWQLQKRTDTLFYAHGSKRMGNKIKPVMMHRFILGITDPDVWVDHKDRNPLNNQKENLRICSKSQSNANRGRMNNTSAYKGIYYDKARDKWVVRPMKDGKQFFVGRFKSQQEAAKAYNEIATKLHGEFAFINHLG